MRSVMKWRMLVLGVAALGAGILCGAGEAVNVAWEVKADPRVNLAATKAAATGPASQRGMAAADPAYVKPNVSLMQVTGTTGRDVFLPGRPSRFVLTLSRWGDGGWEVWDLGKGEKTKEAKGKIGLNDLIFSPDGQYIAGYEYGGKEGARAEVWSLKTGARTAVFKSEKPGRTMKPVGFVGNDRVAMTWSEGGNYFITIANVTTGETTSTIQAAGYVSDRLIFSPSGKYVVQKERDVLHFYDTDTGKVAGMLPLTDGVTGEEGRKIYASDFKGMAWTSTGGEIALLYTTQGYVRIVMIEAATGKVRYERVMEDKTVRGEGKGAAIEYLPDNSGWLLGGANLVDRNTMSIVYTLPSRAGVVWTRAVTASQFLQIVKEDKRLIFETVNVSKEQLAKAVEVVKAGGKAEDAGLPALVQADVAGVQEVGMEGTLAMPWQVVPEAMVAVKKSVAPSLMIKPAPLPPTKPGQAPMQDEITGVFFTSREANTVVVEHSATDRSAAGGPFYRKKNWIERYDLATGLGTATTELPGMMEALDAGPTGETLLMRSGSERDRVDVLKFEKGTYVPVASLRPFGHLPAEKKGFGGLNPRSVWAAALVDDGHVLTMSRGGALILWEVPAGKAVWSTNVEANGEALALSPDRKLGAVAIKGGVCVFEALTGKALNSLPADSKGIAVETLAFSADGTQLVAKGWISNSAGLQVYDLKTGATVGDVVLPDGFAPGEASTVQIVALGYVLVNRRRLVDVERKAVVMNYAAPQSGYGTVVRGGSVQPFERGFFAVGREARMPAAVVNAALPDEEAKKVAKTVKVEELYEWSPGMKVRIQLSVVGDEAYRQRELELWKKTLTGMGFVVADDAPNTLTANTFIMTGEAVQYVVTGTQEKFSISPKTVGHDIRLNVGGKEVWRMAYDKPATGGVGSMVFLEVAKGESVQAAADRQHPTPSQASQVIPPPRYVFKERKVPTMTVTVKGLQVGAATP